MNKRCTDHLRYESQVCEACVLAENADLRQKMAEAEEHERTAAYARDAYLKGLTAAEARIAVLAEECGAWRESSQTCGDSPCWASARVRSARAATDAAGALNSPGSGAIPAPS
jgi:hypothetical protein